MDKPIKFTESSRTDSPSDIPVAPVLPSNSHLNDPRANRDYSYNKDENAYNRDGNTPRKGSSTEAVLFETNEIKKFVDDHGMRVIWERSYLCTCRDPNTGKPDINCKICGGTGRAYLPGQDIRMLIQSQKRGEQVSSVGNYQKGTALGTVNMETPIATKDRITAPDVHIIQAFLFVNTQNVVDHGIKLPYDVHEFLFVASTTGELTIDKDFSYDTKTKVFKVLNNDLLDQNITMRFDATLRYIITDILKENRYQYSNKAVADKSERYEALPKLCELTREQSIIGETTQSFASSSDTLKKLNTELNESVDSDLSYIEPDNDEGGFRI